MNNPGFNMGPGQPVPKSEIPSGKGEIIKPEENIPVQEEKPLEMPSEGQSIPSVPATSETKIDNQNTEMPVDTSSEKVLPVVEIDEVTIKENSPITDTDEAYALTEEISKINP